ncbi:hypothetical protein TRFO_19194 [Tritrichomonas foetus]|uniref:Uncharacterized protein n=1 Tax=Tritrichomonas foetus TaxID=1144522 RepID=A0A1J4KJU9_9EUKA|nr:hypothetical protein TRFO_19194 [Tritrichomonas foetus]|eukprot:OHT11386.1 hypothetical protein TRFO_19194 [Tritrichomonas foetus]
MYKIVVKFNLNRTFSISNKDEMCAEPAEGIFSFTQQGQTHPICYPKDDFHSSQSSRASRSPRNRKVTKFDRAKKTLLEGKELKNPDPSLFPDLTESLKTDYENLMKSGKVKDSQKVYNAFKKSIEIEKNLQAYQKVNEIQEDILNRLNSAKQEKKNMEKTIKNTERNMGIYFEREEEELIQKQDDEFEQFNESWESEKKQRNYNKTSEQLRLLRTQADKLLLNKQYQESAICEKKANELEMMEMMQKNNEMNYDYSNSLQKLREKHAKEQKVLKGRQKMRRTEFISIKNSELKKIDSKIAKIEVEYQKSNEPYFINRIRKSFELTSSKDEQNKETPRARVYRNVGKKDIIVAEFNEIPLPPLRPEERIYKATMLRKSATITPRRMSSNY